MVLISTKTRRLANYSSLGLALANICTKRLLLIATCGDKYFVNNSVSDYVLR